MRTSTLFGVLGSVLGACASTPTTAIPKGGPRGLHANEHLDVARQDTERARQESSWPDTMAQGPDHAGQPVPIPWFRSWNASSDAARLAEIHRSQASELYADYQKACAGQPESEVSVSPLTRYAVGGWMTQTGAIVYLSPKAGAPDALLAALTCHRAWMMLAPANMGDCPLDLPGLVIDARGDQDGVTVSIGVADAKQVPELQRRVAHDLEAGHHTEHGRH